MFAGGQLVAEGRAEVSAHGFLCALLAARGCANSEVVTDLAAALPRGQTRSIWEQLPEEAEYHGVSPLVQPIIRSLAQTAGVVPEHIERSFLALAARHKRATAARQGCTDDLLTAFAAGRIGVVLLKGSALMHQLYPRPELRPMVDIDLLVAPSDIDRAARAAERCGFTFADDYASRFSGRLHHLPAATARRSGFDVALEIHDDALSPDQNERLPLSRLTEPLQRVTRGSVPDGYSLGHTDMLRHLARHAFEPAACVRLIHLYDLWQYPNVFGDEIDWPTLRTKFPHVIAALQLVRYVFGSLPDTERFLGPLREPAPAGPGLGMIPLSEIAGTHGIAAKASALFRPPGWWLHGFYGVPPGASLRGVMFARHPANVARWLARRAWVAAKVRTYVSGAIGWEWSKSWQRRSA
jgi:hypothetical protein